MTDGTESMVYVPTGKPAEEGKPAHAMARPWARGQTTERWAQREGRATVGTWVRGPTSPSSVPSLLRSVFYRA